MIVRTSLMQDTLDGLTSLVNTMNSRLFSLNPAAMRSATGPTNNTASAGTGMNGTVSQGEGDYGATDDTDANGTDAASGASRGFQLLSDQVWLCYVISTW